jgi:hypothetical protein
MDFLENLHGVPGQIGHSIALLLFAVVAGVAISGCGYLPADGSICDKAAISSVAGAMHAGHLIVVVKPMSKIRDAKSSSSDTQLKQVDVQVIEYLYGSGPETITVGQAYNCGSSSDPDYVDLKQDQQYLLFLTTTTPGNWGPLAVPMGFKVDEQGHLHPLHDPARPLEDPVKWVVPTTLDDLAAQISFFQANTPTPAPTIPSPSDIFKPGLVLNFSQIFALDQGLWYKAPALSPQGGQVKDPNTVQRLLAALNVPLTFETTTKPLSLGRDIIIVGFSLPKPVYGVGDVAFDYSSADGVLANPFAVPVQVTLPGEARDIINQAIGYTP